jgi:eukaryotic-like serine/threonine-protein kinase
MRRCRKCNKDWPDTMTACPNDGWSLTVEVDATYAPPTGGMPIATPNASAAMAVAQPHYDEPPPSSDLVAGAVVGEYRVEKKIGEGGMGAVYSAMHPMIGKRAAIKVISAALGTDASAVNRFVQEARSVNQIGHPNIVDVFAFGELPDGRNYFVMEYLQGESLADRIQRTAMPLGEAIEIIDQVADALEAAHEKQIVHRDLKPDNVYLAAVRGGRTMVKLLDFGIAKLSTPDGPGSGGGIQKTRTGMMMGTPGYISPEQARGKNVDHRTDVYALGCMVFEIVCGRLPFVADNAMDIVLMHMTTPAVRASAIWPDIPPPLDDLIARMLEKDPALRPSLTEVRGVFAELVTSGLVTLNNGRGIAFGSNISRLQTPSGGTPRPATQNLAVGTTPQTQAPGTNPPTAAPGTYPPTAAPAKKNTGLIAAGIGAVLLLGGVGAFMAMKGGDQAKPAPAVATPAPEPAKTPEPAVAKAPEPTPVKAPEPVKTVEAPKPATIAITISHDKAQVTVDGKPVEVSGKIAKATVDTEGAHVVAVTAAGREPFEQTVQTKAGETVPVVAKLERAKAGAKKTTKTTTTTTAKTPAADGAGSGSAKKTPAVDKNAPIDPF